MRLQFLCSRRSVGVDYLEAAGFNQTRGPRKPSEHVPASPGLAPLAQVLPAGSRSTAVEKGERRGDHAFEKGAFGRTRARTRTPISTPTDAVLSQLPAEKR